MSPLSKKNCKCPKCLFKQDPTLSDLNLSNLTPGQKAIETFRSYLRQDSRKILEMNKKLIALVSRDNVTQESKDTCMIILKKNLEKISKILAVKEELKTRSMGSRSTPSTLSDRLDHQISQIRQKKILELCEEIEKENQEIEQEAGDIYQGDSQPQKGQDKEGQMMEEQPNEIPNGN